jgi:hypothetical protein
MTTKGKSKDGEVEAAGAERGAIIPAVARVVEVRPYTADIPEPIPLERVKAHFARLEEFKRAVLTPADWLQMGRNKDGSPRMFLKQEGVQRLAFAFGLTELPPEERIEYRPIPAGQLPAWPQGWSEYPIVTVWIGVGAPNGRVAWAGAKCSASEGKFRRADGKFYEDDVSLHNLAARATKRAHAFAVKRLLGGIPWVGEPETDEEEGDQMAPSAQAKGANIQEGNKDSPSGGKPAAGGHPSTSRDDSKPVAAAATVEGGTGGGVPPAEKASNPSIPGPQPSAPTETSWVEGKADAMQLATLEKLLKRGGKEAFGEMTEALKLFEVNAAAELTETQMKTLLRTMRGG